MTVLLLQPTLNQARNLGGPDPPAGLDEVNSFTSTRTAVSQAYCSAVLKIESYSNTNCNASQAYSEVPLYHVRVLRFAAKIMFDS